MLERDVIGCSCCHGSTDEVDCRVFLWTWTCCSWELAADTDRASLCDYTLNVLHSDSLDVCNLDNSSLFCKVRTFREH